MGTADDDTCPWFSSSLADTDTLYTHAELSRFLGGSEDSFTGVLLHLIAKANATPSNMARLRLAFPCHVLASHTWQLCDPAPTAGELRARLEAVLDHTHRGSDPDVRAAHAYVHAMYGPTCPECGRAWVAPSPNCPRRVNNLHPLTVLRAATMGCQGCTPCANCPHAQRWHLLNTDNTCLATITRWIDREAGAPWPVNVPCSCTGYTPKGTTMSTPQQENSPAQAQPVTPAEAIREVDQAVADHGTNVAADAAAATAVIHEANQAYSALHQAMHVAHQTYLDMMRTAHADYSAVMARLHHQVTTTTSDTGKPGAL